IPSAPPKTVIDLDHGRIKQVRSDFESQGKAKQTTVYSYEEGGKIAKTYQGDFEIGQPLNPSALKNQQVFKIENGKDIPVETQFYGSDGKVSLTHTYNEKGLLMEES